MSTLKQACRTNRPSQNPLEINA